MSLLSADPRAPVMLHVKRSFPLARCDSVSQLTRGIHIHYRLSWPVSKRLQKSATMIVTLDATTHGNLPSSGKLRCPPQTICQDLRAGAKRSG